MRLTPTLVVILVGLAMLLVAVWTPDISHSELARRYAAPPSAFLDLPSGARAHYRDIGPRDAMPLVLLHGSAAHVFTWGPWVERLAGGFRVITVDLPGHGLTGATPRDDYWIDGLTAFVAEFVNALGLQRFALGGNSMGGGISTSYTLGHPDRVLALILVDADGLPEDLYQPIEGPVGFSIAHTPGLRWLATVITPRSLVAQGLADVSENPAIVTDEAVDRYWHLLRHPGNRRATILRFKAAEKQPMNYEFEKIAVPTLILWGRADRLIPLANGQAMARRIPNARLAVYDGVGHIPQEEIPDRSAADVAAFLAPLAKAELAVSRQ